MRYLLVCIVTLISFATYSQNDEVVIDSLLLDVFKSSDFQEAKSVHTVGYKLSKEEHKDVVKMLAKYKDFNVAIGDFSYSFSVAMNLFHETGDSVFYHSVVKSEDYENYIQLDSKPLLIGFGGTYNYNAPLQILQYYYNNGLDSNIHFKALKDFEMDKYYSSYSSDKYYVQENYQGDYSISVGATLLKRIINELSDSTELIDQCFGGSEWVKKVVDFPFHFSDSRNEAYKKGRIDWVLDEEKLNENNHSYLFYGGNNSNVFYEVNEINFSFEYSILYVDWLQDLESNEEIKKYKNSKNEFDLVSSNESTNVIRITSKTWNMNNKLYRSYLEYEEDIQYQFIAENQQMDISGMKEILDASSLNFYSGGMTMSGMNDFDWVFGGSFRHGYATGKAFSNDYKLRVNQYSMFLGYNLLNTEYFLIKPEVNLGWSTKRLKYTNLSDSISVGPTYSFPVEYSFDSWSVFTKPMLNIEFGYKALIVGGRVGYLYDFYGSKWDNGLNIRSNTSGLTYDVHLALRIVN